MRVLTWIALCLILLLPTTAFAQTTEDAFFALLRRAEQAAVMDESLDAVRAELNAVETVTLADGREVPVDGAYWAEIFDTMEGRQQINALLDSRDIPLADPQPNARAQLEDVFTRFEINTDFSIPIWQRVLRWLAQLFTQLTESAGGRFGAVVLTGIAVLVTAFIIWWAVRRLRGEVSAENSLPITPLDEDNLTAQSAFAAAQTSAENNDRRSAVRLLYLAAFLSLDERDMLRFDRSKTNREYLRAVAGSEFAPTLRDVIGVFDRVWYGFRPIDPPTFARYQQQVADLLENA